MTQISDDIYLSRSWRNGHQTTKLQKRENERERERERERGGGVCFGFPALEFASKSYLRERKRMKDENIKMHRNIRKVKYREKRKTKIIYDIDIYSLVSWIPERRSTDSCFYVK